MLKLAPEASLVGVASSMWFLSCDSFFTSSLSQNFLLEVKGRFDACRAVAFGTTHLEGVPLTCRATALGTSHLDAIPLAFQTTALETSHLDVVPLICRVVALGTSP